MESVDLAPQLSYLIQFQFELGHFSFSFANVIVVVVNDVVDLGLGLHAVQVIIIRPRERADASFFSYLRYPVVSLVDTVHILHLIERKELLESHYVTAQILDLLADRHAHEVADLFLAHD